MNQHKANNPRSIAEVVSLYAYRTPYSGNRHEANLFIDVVFTVGRVGGSPDSPVRFKLRLKRAEVHILEDIEGTLQIIRSSIKRTHLPQARSKIMLENERQADANARLKIAPKGSDISVSGGGATRTVCRETLEFDTEHPMMNVSHFFHEESVGFKIESIPLGAPLDGQPWDAGEERLRLRDQKPNRNRGEPPSATVQVQCLREDLLVEDVEYKDGRFQFFGLIKTKQVAVEQALKAEIFANGLTCGDLSESFSRLILADAVTREEDV